MIDQQVQDRVAAYRGRPEQLQQKYAMGQDLLDLLALQKIKSEKEAAARQMQLQMAQQQAAQGQAPMTVAQQREKEVHDLTKQELVQQRGATLGQQNQERQAMMQGIAGAPGAGAAAEPRAMAAGGIVGFAGGGPALDSARERVEAAQKKLYSYGFKQQKNDPEGFKAAQEEMKAAEAALASAKGAYGSEMDAAGMSTFPKSPKDLGASGRYYAKNEPEVAATPAGPAVSAAYPDEAKRGSAAGLAALAPAAQTKMPPPPTARPAAPAMAAAKPAAAPAEQKIPEAPPMPAGLAAALEQSYKVNPVAEREAAANWAEKRMAISPEEQKIRDDRIAALRQGIAEQYDPDRVRNEALMRYLIGAGGRRVNVLGSGAAAAMNYEDAMRRAKQKEENALQAAQLDPYAIGRDAAAKGIQAGTAAETAAGQRLAHGISGGANVHGSNVSFQSQRMHDLSQQEIAALNRQVELAKVAAQHAATAASREYTDVAKRQGFIQSALGKRFEIADAVRKAYQRRLDAVHMMLVSKPKDPALTQQLDDIQNEINARIAVETKGIDEQLDKLGGLGGMGGPTPSGQAKVTQIK